MQQHFIFLDNDLSTVDSTTTCPSYSVSAPTAPATGDYWWDTANKTWKRYSGASWESLGRLYLGMAVCDATDCLWTEPADFNLAWNGLITEASLYGQLDAVYYLGGGVFKISVAGQMVEINGAAGNTITFANIESGYAETASTWYYIYISSTGIITVSPIAPRKKDQRLGWYHPREYWRCIGFFYNSAASAINNIFWNPGTGNVTTEPNGCLSTHATTGGVKTHHLTMPPICESAAIEVDQSTSGAATGIIVANGKFGSGVSIMTRTTMNAAAAQPETILLNQIGNATIWFEITGSYTVRFAPSNLFMRW